MLLGLLDSIRGIAVIFYLDREANKKAQAKHVYNVMTPARSKELLSDTQTLAAASRGEANKENNSKRKECVLTILLKKMFVSYFNYAFLRRSSSGNTKSSTEFFNVACSTVAFS
jgi:hypothetical protein